MVEITPRDTTLAEIREDTVRFLCGIVHFTFLPSRLVLCISIIVDCSVEFIFFVYAAFPFYVFFSLLNFSISLPSFFLFRLLFFFLSLLLAIDMIDG